MIRSFNQGKLISHQTANDHLLLKKDTDNQILTLTYEVYSDKEEKMVPVPIVTEYFHISCEALALVAFERRCVKQKEHIPTHLGQDIKEINIYKRLQASSVSDHVFDPTVDSDNQEFTVTCFKSFPKNPNSKRLAIFTKNKELPFIEQCFLKSFNTRIFNTSLDVESTPKKVAGILSGQNNTHVIKHPYELALYLLHPEEHERLYCTYHG
jgi:hypothetical protein